eukprot:Lankesteria_metandrocarpae@DN1799_c0_g1_i1.p1
MEQTEAAAVLPKDTSADVRLEKYTSRKFSFQRPSHFLEYGHGLEEADPSLILHNPHFNKGTAFTEGERDKLHLRGLLPPSVEKIEQQVRRCLTQFHRFQQPMSRYIYLSSLRERCDTLFYRLVIENMELTLPYIYTPTVGQACLEFGLQFRQAEGMYFCKNDKGRMRKMLENWKPNTKNDVQIIVISDGSRILGLGDLGACGMGIPVGKLALYVAVGGFHPACTLPIIFDSGTDNEKLLEDEFYLGLRHRRLPDTEYYPLINELLFAVRDKWPRAVLQFEDFSNNHCFDLLAQYRNEILAFNDDIQGTGVVIAAGFLNALKVAGLYTAGQVKELRVLLYGAGSAGTGVADQIRAVVQTLFKLTLEESYKLFYVMDSKGLLWSGRSDAASLANFKRPYVRADLDKDYPSLIQAVEELKPHALFGLCGQGQVFDAAVLRKMADLNIQPIVFALSNPTSKSECTFESALDNTDCRVVFASGSPFDPVERNGKMYHATQGNNLYAFPGIGFGAYMCEAKKLTDSMMDAATVALADAASAEDLAACRLYPKIDCCRKVSATLAAAVAIQANKEGNALNKDLPYEDAALLTSLVERSMYNPSHLEAKM